MQVTKVFIRKDKYNREVYTKRTSPVGTINETFTKYDENGVIVKRIDKSRYKNRRMEQIDSFILEHIENGTKQTVNTMIIETDNDDSSNNSYSTYKEVYARDLNGNPIYEINDEGEEIRYTYDENGNCIKEERPEFSITNKYDDKNRIVYSADSEGNRSYVVYTEDGDKIIYSDNDMGDIFIEIEKYDKNGNMVYAQTETIMKENASRTDQIIKMYYNKNGKCIGHFNGLEDKYHQDHSIYYYENGMISYTTTINTYANGDIIKVLETFNRKGEKLLREVTDYSLNNNETVRNRIEYEYEYEE